MLAFRNDYSEGAHEKILELLTKSNREINAGYGLDSHSARAAGLIKARLGTRDGEVFFIPGGTQTNMLAISAFLRPYQAAVAVDTGHINVHETGAVEGSGHKILTLPGSKGKMEPGSLEALLELYTDEHMVQPGLVYLSDTTELGTVYTKRELTSIHEICRKRGLILYLDGARLASALTSEKNDMTLEDLSQLCDAFYIGGTKNGALFGEALVIMRKDLQENFRYMIKNRGAMLAKGFVAAMQFEALFEGELYFELGAHANAMAKRLADGILEAGFRFLSPPESNQLFVIVTKEQANKLQEQAAFEIQEQLSPEEIVIRLVTSWATTESTVDEMNCAMRALSEEM